MMLMFPKADVPIVAVSLKKGQDPATHLRIGEALAPLREEGVLIVGSGYAFHNFRYFFARGEEKKVGIAHSQKFDAWLRDAITSPSSSHEERRSRLTKWADAPSALECHPPGAAEHLLPLHVVAGAGQLQAGKHLCSDDGGMGVVASTFQWD
eukprot:Hpha_TRINITY_DN24533_c0_g1::TRINITY_DN24533_c0_g1_i1::g.172682::m.172682